MIPLFGDHSDRSRQTWHPFRNDSGETIPAFGVFKCIGSTTINGLTALLADKPDGTGSIWSYFVNGARAVADGAYGECTIGDVVTVRYSSGTPVSGEHWGPQADSWDLHYGTSGWVVLDVLDSEEGILLANRSPLLSSTTGPGGNSGSHACDPWQCTEYTVDISETCDACPCAPDPWLINVGSVNCGDADLFVGDWTPLWYNSGDSGDGVCLWDSVIIESAGREFFWRLALVTGGLATLSLYEAIDGDRFLLASWRTEEFCCRCANTLDAVCPPYLPLLCENLPAWVCVRPALAGELDGELSTCVSDECPEGIARLWQVDVPSAGEFVLPSGMESKAETVCESFCDAFSGYMWLVDNCLWNPSNRMVALTDWPVAPASSCTAGGQITTIGYGVNQDGYVVVRIVWRTVDRIGSDAVYGPEFVAADYVISMDDFDCDGPNTLELNATVGDWGTKICTEAPTTITITPIGSTLVLVDPDGNPILDENGNPIPVSSFTPCEADTDDPSCDNAPTNPGYGVFVCTDGGWVFCNGPDPGCPEPPWTCGAPGTGGFEYGDFAAWQC